MRLAFCNACPAAPFTRLSSAASTVVRPEWGSSGDLQVHAVGAVRRSRARQLAGGQHMDERLVVVGRVQGVAQDVRAETPGAVRAVQVARIPRDIGASVGVNSIETGCPGCEAQRLLHLGGVLMGAAHLVRAHRAHDLARQQAVAGLAAGAGGAGGGHDDDVLRLHQVRGQQGSQGQGDRRRVAAGVRYPRSRRRAGRAARAARAGRRPRCRRAVVLP